MIIEESSNKNPPNQTPLQLDEEYERLVSNDVAPVLPPAYEPGPSRTYPRSHDTSASNTMTESAPLLARASSAEEELRLYKGAHRANARLWQAIAIGFVRILRRSHSLCLKSHAFTKVASGYTQFHAPWYHTG